MADNIKVLPDGTPAGLAVATDDIGGVHYPIYKMSYGALGTQTPVTGDNRLPVAIDSKQTAFGELKTSHNTPQVQIKFPYNLNTEVGQALWNNASSTVTAGGGIATVTCAGTANAFSQIRTKDVLRYGPGQGAEFMGTCSFTTGVANSSQVFGIGDDDEGFFFGYNGTSFGVLHRDHGALEIRHLTITNGASAGAGNITITVDGTAVVIAVANGDTISEVCAKIVASADFWNAGRGWEVETHDNISIEFISLVAENAAGTFSFVDTDSTGVTAGTFNQATTEIEGSAPPTELWTAQADWNVDTMSTLNPTKLNVFKIQYQYLGAGGIEYWIESGETSKFVHVHTEHYANANTIPSLQNPTLHLTLIAKTETGYSGSTLVMKTASMAGFIQGAEALQGVRHSAHNTKTTTGTTPVAVLGVVNDFEFQGYKNKVVIYPDFMNIASEAGKTVEIAIIRNPTQIDGTAALIDVDSDNSVVKYITAGTTVVGGEEIVAFLLEGAQSKEVDISSLDLAIRPGERWVMTAALSSGADAPVTIDVTWKERI